MLYGIITVITSVLIFLIVFAGASYYILHNNINGLAEKYRESLQNLPIAKYALPPLPQGEDPENPKYLNETQLIEKYNELRQTRDNLKKELESANGTISELQAIKDNQEQALLEVDNMKKKVELAQQDIDKQKEQLSKEKEAVDKLIASGDKTGFKQYFESIDPELAGQIYGDIIQKEKISEETKDFAKRYESMEPSATAGIFESMGTSKIDLIVDILGNMKSSVYAEILGEMRPDFAAKVTEKMAEVNLK